MHLNLNIRFHTFRNGEFQHLRSLRTAINASDFDINFIDMIDTCQKESLSLGHVLTITSFQGLELEMRGIFNKNKEKDIHI